MSVPSPVVYASKPGDFDVIDLTFTDNTICYQDNYLVIVSGKCLLVHSTPTAIWVLANRNLQQLINSIDVQFIQHRCVDYPSYLGLVETTYPSFKISPGGEFNLLKIELRPTTEIYGSVTTNPTQETYIRAVLYARCNRNQILWYAQKIQYPDQSLSK